MNLARRNETPKYWSRSDRVFLSDDQWFFRTREGIDVGPYESQFEAEIEAGMLMELLRDREHCEPGGTMAVIREFVLESYAMGRPIAPTFPHATSVSG